MPWSHLEAGVRPIPAPVQHEVIARISAGGPRRRTGAARPLAPAGYLAAESRLRAGDEGYSSHRRAQGGDLRQGAAGGRAAMRLQGRRLDRPSEPAGNGLEQVGASRPSSARRETLL